MERHSCLFFLKNKIFKVFFLWFKKEIMAIFFIKKALTL